MKKGCDARTSQPFAFTGLLRISHVVGVAGITSKSPYSLSDKGFFDPSPLTTITLPHSDRDPRVALVVVLRTTVFLLLEAIGLHLFMP